MRKINKNLFNNNLSNKIKILLMTISLYTLNIYNAKWNNKIKEMVVFIP